MTDTYSGSYCNIAAAQALHSAEGLFDSRKSAVVSPVFVRPEWTDHENLPILVEEDILGSVDDAPLHRRGWVLQERLLARRTIHFSWDRIFWECKTHTSSEALPMKKNIRGSDNEDDWLNGISTKEREDVEQGTLSWRIIIETYTGCQLTKEDDKLVAIAGLAQRFHMHSKDVYLAGLWRTSLVDDLCWVADDSGQTTVPIRYRAPSWSWAAIDVKIRFRYSGRKPLLTLVDYEITTFTDDPFSQVTSGLLKILRTLVRVNVSCDENGECQLNSVYDFVKKVSHEEETLLDIFRVNSTFDAFLLPVTSTTYGKEAVLPSKECIACFSQK
jgi:hypothetical protein